MRWVGEVAGRQPRYGLIVDDGDRTLVDPDATAVCFSPEHDRDAARPGRGPNHDIAPLAVAQPWPDCPARVAGPTRPLVVSEMHVRGATKRRARTRGGDARRSDPRTATAGGARGVGDRVAAGAPVRPGRGQLLGVHGARLRRSASAVRCRRRRQPGTRRSGGGRPRPRHRGVARRGVQPHDRGGRARPDLQPAGLGRPVGTTCATAMARTSTRPAAATSSTPTRRSRGT